MGIRTFIGIALGTHVRDTLLECGSRIRQVAGTWRGEKWVTPENLHITLKFLGTLPDDTLPEVESIAVETCAGFRPYPISLAEVHAVPRLRTARMLWTGIGAGAARTSALASAIEHAMEAAGHTRNERPFSPHVTLVRAREPQAIPFEAIDAANRFLYGADERDIAMSVRGVTVYSSTLTPQGPVYEELAFLPFPG
ncbi:MAG: RNA 2',3'-cyclic phosphodiesterase [Coriobacteriia bacterium]